MSVSGIQHNNVYLSLYQSFHTIQNIGCDTYCSSAEQTALCVLCGQRIFDLFLDIFDGDKTFGG